MAVDQQKTNHTSCFRLAKSIEQNLVSFGGYDEGRGSTTCTSIGSITPPSLRVKIFFLPNGNHGAYVEDNVTHKDGAGEIVDTDGNCWEI